LRSRPVPHNGPATHVTKQTAGASEYPFRERRCVPVVRQISDSRWFCNSGPGRKDYTLLMEVRRGILGGVTERVLSGVAFVVVIAIAWSIYQMPGETKTAILAGVWSSILWVVIAAALPWSAKMFITRILELGNNWAGVALIGGFTLFDLVLGLIFMGGLPGDGWSWFACLGAIAVVGTYNYLVTEYLADMAGV
jgi:hypothetical protein